MAEEESSQGSQVRRLPGRWFTRCALVAIFGVFVGFDIRHESVDLTSVAGWAGLILPYLPLLGLTFGAVPGVVVYFLSFIGVVGILQGDLVVMSAMVFPAIIVVGFCTFLLPWKRALTFGCSAIAITPSVLLVNPAGGRGVIFTSLIIFFSAAAGLGLNLFLRRTERSEKQVHELREHQARVRKEERTRLAHELHDIVAHDVTVIAMQARRAEFVADPAKTAKILESIGLAAQQALQDLRSLVTLLQDQSSTQPERDVTAESPQEQRTPELAGGETTTAAGFIQDVKSVADAIERAGFPINLEVEGAVARVPASLRQVLRRTFRELGTNILKHGDPTGSVVLRLAVADDHVSVGSTNTVAGGVPIMSTETGLAAMRARCEVFGGHLTTDRQQDRWTTTMTIPLDKRGLTDIERVQHA